MENQSTWLQIEQTTKFDVIAIEVTFSQLLNEQMLEKRTLLAKVLPKILAKFPSKLQTRSYFANLYAAKIGCFTNKVGALHDITLQLLFADPSAIQDDEYTIHSIMECIEQIILHPFIVDDGFDYDMTNVEKNILTEKIKQIYDDKTTYAQVQLIKNMYKDSIYGLSSYGEIDNYAAINERDLYQTYLQMLAHDMVKLNIVGNVDVMQWQTWSHNLTATMKNKTIIEAPKVAVNFGNEVAYVQQTQQIKQSKLHIGYHVPTDITQTDYLHHCLANEILGSGTQSKLFMNVREKASLAYYVASVLDAHINGMFIYAGVEADKLKQAEQIIDEQIQAIQQGEFTDADIEMAKMQMLHRLSMSQDTPWGMMALAKKVAQLSHINTIQDWEAAINNLTVADAIKASKTWNKTTVFTLVPNEGGKIDE